MSGLRDATRQFRIQQWTKIIHDRAESGMSIKDYCKQHNFSRDAYFYWAKIIKEEALKNLPAQQFVEVPAVQDLPQVSQTAPTFTTELKLQIKDVSITVTDSTSPSLLSRTLEVLRNAL